MSGSSAGEHACALTIDGEVVCWGQRSKPGGPVVARSVSCLSNDDSRPRLVDGVRFVTKRLGDNTGRLRHVRSIAAYENTTCAVTHDERVFCWGEHGAGLRAPQAPTHCATQSVSEHPHAPRQVALGNGFACTLSSAGEIACWGTNANLQLGQAGGGSCPQQRTNCSSTALRYPSRRPLCSPPDAPPAASRQGRKSPLLGTAPRASDRSPLTERRKRRDRQRTQRRLTGSHRGVGAVTQLGMGDNHGCVVGDDVRPEVLGCAWHRLVGSSGSAGRRRPKRSLLSRTAYLRRLTRRRSSKAHRRSKAHLYVTSGPEGSVLGLPAHAARWRSKPDVARTGCGARCPEFAFSLGCAGALEDEWHDTNDFVGARCNRADRVQRRRCQRSKRRTRRPEGRRERRRRRA